MCIKMLLCTPVYLLCVSHIQERTDQDVHSYMKYSHIKSRYILSTGALREGFCIAYVQ